MNKFIFIGRLTKDPELQTTSNGISMANFSVAVNRKYKNADGNYDADFFYCTAWRQAAETIAKFCKKGDRIMVSGEIQNRTYDAEDGTKKYMTNYMVNEFEFLNSKKDASNDEDLEPVPDEALPF